MPRRIVVHTPTPLRDIMPALWSLSAVATILAGISLLQAVTVDPPSPQEEPIVYGAVQPSFRFQRLDPGTRDPVRYDPCAPIAYVVNDDLASAGGVDDVHRAFSMIGRVSGLRFTFEGFTDEYPTSRREPYQPARYGPRWAPVLVSWHHLGENALSHTPVGQGGSVAVPNADGRLAYVTGRVQLNADLSDVEPGFAPGRSWGKVLLHELAHLVGLAHVADRDQLMYPATTDGPTQLGRGDRVGLARLGANAGCLRAPPPPLETSPPVS